MEDKINVAGEDLGLTQEDEVGLVDINEVLEIKEVPGDSFDVPGDYDQRLGIVDIGINCNS